MRCNVNLTNPLTTEAFLVDLHLFRELRDVGDVDLNGSISESLHELIVDEFVVFRLIGMPDDHLVNVGLRELLRLDFVLLRRAQQVVQNATSSLSISINSTIPRFATWNSPSKLNALGSDSEP